MPINAEKLKKLVDDELRLLSSPEVVAHIRSLLVEPEVIYRGWDNGNPGEQYPCWAILDDNPSNSNTGIAYCESGFGPRCPWGLVSLNGDHMSMGMDCGWFSTFLDAYFDSFASAAVPIWCVCKIDVSGNFVPLTDEGDWHDTCALVEDFQRAEPESKFFAHHGISYSRESE